MGKRKSSPRLATTPLSGDVVTFIISKHAHVIRKLEKIFPS